MPLFDVEYVKYYVGDVVREKYWIAAEPEGVLYGIIVSVVRDGYKNAEWIDYGEDQLTVFWFKWRQTETLPSCFVEIVSRISGVTHEETTNNSE